MARTNKSAKEQKFSFRAPHATSVQLVADFTHWQDQPVHLKKDGNGVWRAGVQLEPGIYHYRFLVDGEWEDDPQCTLRAPNSFGSENMICEVAADRRKPPETRATIRKVSNQNQQRDTKYEHANY